jgi:glycosyltransferase involved in cell wall biosynthesis
MNYDIICFCHLRWNFVYQRPQHLLSRFARDHRVFLIEEPVYDEQAEYLEITQDADSQVWVIVPHLQTGRADDLIAQTRLLNSLLATMNITQYLLWYYSPMALAWSDHLKPVLVVYDCMDELSAFKFAPPELVKWERNLFKHADIVFTGGFSLYQKKRHFHPHVFPVPSSIDKEHFGIARTEVQQPDDQASIPHPRLGFYGVIDERLDIELVKALAEQRPDWHFILIGPVVKINPDSLPQANNIHYLGGKQYKELPQYLAGWDIAIMPFAINESTQFISPTKTPEYLAGGKPVISTAIKDVVTPYGDRGLVHIAATPAIFIAAAEAILIKKDYDSWLAQTDAYLADISWDKTWLSMQVLINKSIKSKPAPNTKSIVYV